MDDHERSGEACFDPTLGAWVLTRYTDVSAALRDTRLSMHGSGAGADAAHLVVSEAAAHAMSSARLVGRHPDLESSARALAGHLPTGEPVDLIGAFARPWSVALADRVTGAPAAEEERLVGLAREVFLAAASATDSEFPPRAQAAAAELAERFPGANSFPDVQAYVALSQTLPGFLAAAWLELFRRPDEADRLRTQPELMPAAVEELLRHAGLARAVFRRARAALTIGHARLGPGDRVILMLSAANHDPERFPDPWRLDIRREAVGHLAFGGGTHACPGAPLIRTAIAVATRALLNTTSTVEPVGEVEWIGGFAIRAPASLPVVLQRRSVDSRPATL